MPILTLFTAVAAVLLCAGSLFALRHRSELFVLFVLAAAPFRVPLEYGDSTFYLLIPLYAVIASGIAAYWLGWLPRMKLSPSKKVQRFERILAAFIAVYIAQTLYSSDPGEAVTQIIFFYIPFGVLYLLLTRCVDWKSLLVRNCLWVGAGMALIFCAVAFGEYATHHLLLNPRVINANQFESYFRVNSLFFDPNIFGRYLMVVMLAVTAALLWSKSQRAALLATAAVAVMWVGLVLSFSQSSLVALLVGLGVLAALRWQTRWVLGSMGAVVIISALVLVAFPQLVHLKSGQAAVDRATSGRFALSYGGVQLFLERPLLGYGSGSFAREFRAQKTDKKERLVSASHTTPITIAAEQGLAGLLLYLGLLVAAFSCLWPGAARFPARAAIVGAFAAMIVHSLLYAAFLEDPLTWILLAIGIALVTVKRPDRPEASEEVLSLAN